MAQLSEQEAKTRDMFDAYRKADKWSDDFSRTQIVFIVFTAMWMSSLTVERIQKVGEAITGTLELDLQATLTRLTREKILRSRVLVGKRVYEVNY